MTPTNELRWFTEYMHQPPRLQQLWRDEGNYLTWVPPESRAPDQWRDVPTVYASKEPA